MHLWILWCIGLFLTLSEKSSRRLFDCEGFGYWLGNFEFTPSVGFRIWDIICLWSYVGDGWGCRPLPSTVGGDSCFTKPTRLCWASGFLATRSVTTSFCPIPSGARHLCTDRWAYLMISTWGFQLHPNSLLWSSFYFLLSLIIKVYTIFKIIIRQHVTVLNKTSRPKISGCVLCLFCLATAGHCTMQKLWKRGLKWSTLTS